MSKEKSAPDATLTIEGKSYSLPIVCGTENDRAIDIGSLLQQTGYTTLDPGYKNTASCTSDITFLDGKEGILSYRGYAIEELAEKCVFIEVAYLLVHGHLPNPTEYEHFRGLLNQFSLIHEDMIHFFDHFPPNSPPMTMLSVMVNSLSTYYPEMSDDPLKRLDLTAARLISKIRTIAAFSYKKSMGHPLVYPSPDRSYCANFLSMMFDKPVQPYMVHPEAVAALNKLLILHADHEQNCSTSTVRLVGSAGVNLYASISAGINALWGPLHGGANEAVVTMLETIHSDGDNFKKYIDKAKDKSDPFKLSGFGHRVYKTFDPRGKIIKEACDDLLEVLNVSDPLLDIARRLEEIALNDQYFVERNLFPNVDFYSGIIYRALGIPTNMFTVMFALGRLPGWIAQWKEQQEDPNGKIGRPRQVYIGEPSRPFVPMSKR
ncbi:MAG: citrate synthase [Candidatus Electrothrix communis]|nr:citrate synthase [Desulfobulbus sp. US4]WLE97252.1 MAG: citrate synthase [Candidatus Electrothrix communis]